jgi:hypothetical protein
VTPEDWNDWKIARQREHLNNVRTFKLWLGLAAVLFSVPNVLSAYRPVRITCIAFMLVGFATMFRAVWLMKKDLDESMRIAEERSRLAEQRLRAAMAEKTGG